jgi:hypothetical protein
MLKTRKNQDSTNIEYFELVLVPNINIEYDISQKLYILIFTRIVKYY